MNNCIGTPISGVKVTWGPNRCPMSCDGQHHWIQRGSEKGTSKAQCFHCDQTVGELPEPMTLNG